MSNLRPVKCTLYDTEVLPRGSTPTSLQFFLTPLGGQTRYGGMTKTISETCMVAAGRLFAPLEAQAVRAVARCVAESIGLREPQLKRVRKKIYPPDTFLLRGIRICGLNRLPEFYLHGAMKTDGQSRMQRFCCAMPRPRVTFQKPCLITTRESFAFGICWTRPLKIRRDRRIRIELIGVLNTQL